MNPSRVVGVVCLSIAFLASAPAGAATVIDDFHSGSITVSRLADSPAVATQTGLDGSRVVGGERSITVGLFGTAPQSLSVDADAGQLEFETGDTPGYFTVEYGSLDSPLDLDLLADGSNAFVIDYAPVPTLMDVVVHSAGVSDRVGLGAFAVVLQPLPNGMRRAVIPFALYNPNLDFRRVERIELSVGRYPRSSRLVIDRFATIPEPSTLLLVSAFLSTAQGRRRLSRPSVKSRPRPTTLERPGLLQRSLPTAGRGL